MMIDRNDTIYLSNLKSKHNHLPNVNKKETLKIIIS